MSDDDTHVIQAEAHVSVAVGVLHYAECTIVARLGMPGDAPEEQPEPDAEA